MSKKVSQEQLRKLMGSKLKKKPTKRTSAPVTSSTTEDLIALKKIKLLQQGHLKNTKRNETSNLASKINHNADKYHAKATKFAKIHDDDDKREMPEGFFADAQEAREKMPNIETTTRDEPMESQSNTVTDIKDRERIN
jgi:hypothetical protein